MANSNNTNGTTTSNGTTHTPSQAESDIKLKLLQNGGIQRIEATLRQRLDAAGWSQDLREYIDRLLRSGTASTYPEIMDIVMKNIGSNGTDTLASADGTAAPNLAIPRDAAVDAAEVIKGELRQICKTPK